ncbi:MAG: leucine-rich repeat domain-containing protein [Acidobacteria bacterium]|jgi:Leucine-rich repeat (LRR) protein|nr:leucine-rich repeat domain-containing protein [Acidobacteriota bacterium]
MSDDLKLIEQLEKETGIKLDRFSLEEIGGYKVTGFAADDNGRVRGLAIWEKKLRCLPAPLSKLQRLEKLVLADTQISDMSNLKELKRLTVLDLARNQISDISSLKELKNLKQLYLVYNKITHIPAEFLDLGLEIKWNYDGKNDDIYLEENPLESPPMEIIKKGMDAIRQYFKSLKGEKQALKQHPSDKRAKELVFISYSRKDEDFVLPLCKKLKELGVEIWLDQWDIAREMIGIYLSMTQSINVPGC